MPGRRDIDVGLEIGCGRGDHLREVPGELAVGIDLDPAVLAEVMGEEADGAALVCADARRVPLCAASVTSVGLRAVLHHLDPVEDALIELARVVRPGGTLTIVDGTALPPDAAEALDVELSAAGRPPEPIAGFDVEALGTTIDAAGFTVTSVHLDGTATFATPPIVSRHYRSDRFHLVATRR